MSTTEVATARYSWGGDDHIFVELAEEMSLLAMFRAMAITNRLRDERPDGVLDICPANASYQVRYDPDVIEPRTLLALLQDVEAQVGDATDVALATRVVEIPVLYRDPWTTVEPRLGNCVGKLLDIHGVPSVSWEAVNCNVVDVREADGACRALLA